MKFSIIGAGNGGLAFSTLLLKEGYQVNIYDKFEEVLEPIRQNSNQLKYKNENYTFNLVTTSIKECIEEADYIFIVTPAFAHEEMAKELVKYVEAKQKIIINPGRTGGAVIFKNIFQNNKKDNIIAETETLLFSCRKTSSLEIEIYGTKEKVSMASIPANEVYNIVEDLNEIFPNFYAAENILHTSLSNIGAIFHPTIFLFNITKVQNKEPFTFYVEGLSEIIAAFMEKIDEERLEIAKSFGVEVASAHQWLKEKYNVHEETLLNSIKLNKNYSKIMAPDNVNNRYILEDVPMSLVPLYFLAKDKNVETKAIKSIIDLSSILYNRDFLSEGRDVSGIINDYIK